MKIKSVVKVMNFHSLLRVDKSRKNAEKFFSYENKLTDFADDILNNRNLLLDKKIIKLPKNNKPLNIYIGNDLGFCGNFNSNVNNLAKEDVESNKIIIGKKVFAGKENVLLKLTKEDYYKKTRQVEDIIYDTIKKGKASEINIIYNHYKNISNIELEKKKILPLEQIEKDKKKYYEDFAVEGDLSSILTNIIVLYVSYEIRIATENSYAAENVMRQAVTKQSLEKIDEIEAENKRIERKEKNAESYKKVLEDAIKLSSLENNDE